MESSCEHNASAPSVASKVGIDHTSGGLLHGDGPLTWIIARRGGVSLKFSDLVQNCTQEVFLFFPSGDFRCFLSFFPVFHYFFLPFFFLFQNMTVEKLYGERKKEVLFNDQLHSHGVLVVGIDLCYGVRSQDLHEVFDNIF